MTTPLGEGNLTMRYESQQVSVFARTLRGMGEQHLPGLHKPQQCCFLFVQKAHLSSSFQTSIQKEFKTVMIIILVVIFGMVGLCLYALGRDLGQDGKNSENPLAKVIASKKLLAVLSVVAVFILFNHLNGFDAIKNFYTKQSQESQCKKGNVESCEQIYMGIMADTSKTNKSAQLLSFSRYSNTTLEKTCNENNPRACGILALNFIVMGKSGKELLQKACSMGDADGCSNFLTGHYGGSNSEILKALASSCQKGKNCDLYGGKLYDGSNWTDANTGKDAFTSAHEALAKLCDSGSDEACKFILDFSEKYKNLSLSEKYFKESCKKKNKTSCNLLAQTQIKTKSINDLKKKEDAKKAADARTWKIVNCTAIYDEYISNGVNPYTTSRREYEESIEFFKENNCQDIVKKILQEHAMKEQRERAEALRNNGW